MALKAVYITTYHLGKINALAVLQNALKGNFEYKLQKLIKHLKAVHPIALQSIFNTCKIHNL